MLRRDDGIKFENPLCPFIFKNARLRLLDISKLSTGLMTKNIFSFYNVSKNVETINSYVHQFVVSLYHYNLDKKLLNQLVFKKIFLGNP